MVGRMPTRARKRPRREALVVVATAFTRAGYPCAVWRSRYTVEIRPSVPISHTGGWWRMRGLADLRCHHRLDALPFHCRWAVDTTGLAPRPPRRDRSPPPMEGHRASADSLREGRRAHTAGQHDAGQRGRRVRASIRLNAAAPRFTRRERLAIHPPLFVHFSGRQDPSVFCFHVVPSTIAVRCATSARPLELSLVWC